MSREGVPLDIIQRQLGHTDLGVTSTYRQGIGSAEIVNAVHGRRADDAGEGGATALTPSGLGAWRAPPHLPCPMSREGGARGLDPGCRSRRPVSRHAGGRSSAEPPSTPDGVVRDAGGGGRHPHLAEPAETDREDARWLQTLLAEGRLPEAWIAPAHVREWRTRTRLRQTLVDERTTWLARVQATLFHHGVAGVPDKLLSAAGRGFLDGLELPAAARERIEVALALPDALDRQLAPIEAELRQLARRQPGCRALMAHYGVGELTAPLIL
jgi:hypothetical protein